MYKRKYPHIRQHDQMDCGAACIAMVSSYFGQKMSLGKYRELIKTDASGSTVYGIVKGAEKIGLNATALSGEYNDLIDGCKKNTIKFPFIAHVITEEGYTHFIVVYEIKKGKIKIGDPAKDIIDVPVDVFCEMWTGTVITFGITETFKKGNYKKKSMKRYIHIIFEQKRHLIVIILLSILIALINMAGTTLFEYIVDGLYDEPSELEIKVLNFVLNSHYQALPLGKVCISVIALYIFQAIMQYIRDKASLNITKKISMPVVLKYYTKLTRLPIEFYSGRKIGDIMTRFDDATRVCQILVNMIFTIVIDGFLAVFYGIYMTSVNGMLFLVTLSILFLYAFIVLIFKKDIRKYQIIAMSKNSNLNSYLKESVQGMETIKSFGIERIVRKKTLSLVTDCVESDYRIGRISSIQENLIYVITSIGTVALLWVGATLCSLGTITTGELIAYYAIMGCFFSPMQNIISLQTQIQSGIVAAERLNDIMDLEVEDTCDKKDIYEEFECGDIQVNNVTFRYGARNAILNSCSLEIKENSCVALVGKSGSGKSTLAKLIVGFYEPETGFISINGKKVCDISKATLRKKVTYITQDTFLFSDSIKNNLFLDGLNISKEEIDKVLSGFEVFNQLPYGLETIVEENGQNLSGGQKQQIAFMRAVLRDTEILILDETTSNLDAYTEKIIQKKIKELCKNITVIIISHRLDLVKNCEQIYYMIDGRVDGKGTHDELLAQNSAYQHLWTSYIQENI